MSVSMRFEGGRDIERALANLPRGTSKGIARRALRNELRPVKEMAEAFWPGAGEAFKISSQLKRGQRPAVREARSVTVMNVGSFEPHAHLIEFGTGPRYTRAGAFRGSVAPQPMLQPAWDMHKGQLLEGLGARLWDEIKKTQARRAKKAARA
jgi:hypothetical protein